MEVAAVFILLSFLVGLVTAGFYVFRVMSIRVSGSNIEETSMLSPAEGATGYGALAGESHFDAKGETTDKLNSIAAAIEEGASAFLFAEYTFIVCFMTVFGILVGVLLPVKSWETAVSFLWGGFTSLVCGYIGMKIAVKTNVRTAKEAWHGVMSDESGHQGYTRAFNAAFQGGCVMGFALVSLGVCNLFVLVYVMEAWVGSQSEKGASSKFVFEAVAGYGLGGSTMALFGRVGGGIFTKAADVGADLVGKVEQGIPEDDPRNPATIADNVGDNVGDIAGMGSDLFGSFAESTCAALVIATNMYAKGDKDEKFYLADDSSARWFPITVSAAGILVCMIVSFIPHFWPVKEEAHVERQLKVQLIASTVLTTPAVYAIAMAFLPDEFFYEGHAQVYTNTNVFICIVVGLWSGLIIGLVTEYYTSHSYRPVREVAESCSFGASTNIINGLALGYKSCIVPTVFLAVTICTGYRLAGQYGIAMGALGMLSTLCVGLAIDGYGPISDNAGGIAEMADLPEGVREITDALDAAGNTTAAIGKGFAIGSAALVSLALFAAFTVRSNICNAKSCNVDILQPLTFTGLLIGAMIPYWFSAMTMKSVASAAMEMVAEVRRQLVEDTVNGPKIMAGELKPDYARCVAISTKASLKEMILPGALVIFTPILMGWLLGKGALAGLLAGAMVSGVQMAVSAANTGGAWDNAKKYIEKGNCGGKGSKQHEAAVIGDTVGDPLKDTSGPALNIVMKLMAIISLVFADFIDNSGGILGKKIDPASFE
eukprot:CAMPEP_0114551910 /NCGR_PEP_ID=MMETSP0114-20121206/6849_1 /TAXON_ID=31324 /ORGANISM="Goniomonas sp, Strain m" /LENGTH=768 /DNA_ID=CAMNT_0001736763 /DNA_START=16 /DNA_END=2322 /DNA_ORIENTATION=+